MPISGGRSLKMRRNKFIFVDVGAANTVPPWGGGHGGSVGIDNGPSLCTREAPVLVEWDEEEEDDDGQVMDP